MRTILLTFASAALLTACSPADEPATDPVPSDNVATTPPTAPPPTGAPVAPPVTPVGDECGAADRQGWVGQPRSAVPTAPAGQNWRVYQTDEPVTQDMRPDRLNVEIDPTTQNVVRVFCG